MAGFFFRGILIGLLFGVPAGAVGAMTAQRTWNFGIRAGLLTGLGSSVADCFYACVGVFGLTLISDFLLRYQSIIHLAGGVLIFLIGLHLLIVRQSKEWKETKKKKENAGLFFSSFAVGITNPAAVLTFLFAFSWFGIDRQTTLFEGIGLVTGVFVGTYLWWGILSLAVSWLKKKTKKLEVVAVNKMFGCILVLFAIVIVGGELF